ncbi:hypothetical protein BDF20DRAFT_848787 [Mycotypha africana]|uniref:uncharacterized protein n=1 Tax=Mycotypha africana TaxID=64632 RepID=UPI002301E653|nr:uncharacterized protein BDF20DRAFT_848787 [Mycotypha africana]KAI8992179.1 hypothetical protein BDF20DRAFT_848787 [Mycotypha africana]
MLQKTRCIYKSSSQFQITIHNCFLNVPVKKPYVTITLGDQYHRTSISEYAEGAWNESFELKVTYHNQLFDTIQLDLYDSNIIFMDKHIGRSEIRIKHLEGMPEQFTSFYEVFEKKLSIGATSQVSRRTIMTSGVGAIQAEIVYQYRYSNNGNLLKQQHRLQQNISFDLSEMNWLIDQHRRALSANSTMTTNSTGSSVDNVDVDAKDTNDRKNSELIEEFNRHLDNQRNYDDIKFKKVEEQKTEEEDYPDNSSSSGYNSSDEPDNVKDRRECCNNGVTLNGDMNKNDNNITNKRPVSLTYSVSRASSTTTVKETWSSANNTSDPNQRNSRSDTNEEGGGIFKSVSSFFGFRGNNSNAEPKQQQQHLQSSSTTSSLYQDYNSKKEVIKDQNEDSLRSFPILDAIGSWTMAKETSQVLRAIGKLLVAFGQGFELSNFQILMGFHIVEKFYNDLPRKEERTWDLVDNLEEIEMASYMWRYAIASYGWKGLNFIGKGNGILSDAVRAQSDALSICEHLEIPKDDLLAYELRTGAAFRPSYFIARDRKLNAIVLSIRGTMSTFDTMTDLVCEYEPWKGGIVHKGMKSSATWFFRHIAPKLIAYVNKHSTQSLYIVGHSLGASTGAILTIMLQDYINEFRKGKDSNFNIYCLGYAPACGLSLNLANKYKDQIQSIVFADDFVSKLSYGSMMDVKELIIAGAEAAKTIGFGHLIWGGGVDRQLWKKAFERVAECRKRCLETLANPRLYVAGTIYQFWLDPTPEDESRIVIERTTPERVSTELIIRRSILLDHLPTNFDVAFRRAMTSLEKASRRKDGRKDTNASLGRNEDTEDKGDKIFEDLAGIGLKRTTERTAGDGNVLGEQEKR